MNKFPFLAILILALAPAAARAASHQPKQEADEGKLVATCSNHEASYEFYAGENNKIEYAIVKNKPYPDKRIDCSAGGHGLISCQEQYEANELTLEAGGYAVMHYNTDNDSDNDGQKARCTGSYFR